LGCGRSARAKEPAGDAPPRSPLAAIHDDVNRAEIDAVPAGLGRGVALCDLLTYFLPDSRTYAVPVLLKRQCDRALGAGRRGRQAAAGARPRPAILSGAV
jgi:hypothetical protein